MDKIINIISESYDQNITGGPRKVIENTLKGLQKIDCPYVINKDIRNYRYNWIHDSVKGLIEVGFSRIPAVVGPNLVVLPKDLPAFRAHLKNCIYLHPSDWCVKVWREAGFSECSLQSWPVGIDSENFSVKRQNSLGKDVMIYYKRRNPHLLIMAVDLISSMGLNPHIIKYGEYSENEYKQLLARCSFGVWLGISESQGIGLQEALASGLPLIVCDVNSLFESSSESDYKFPEELRSFKPTSAPYFDERCGIILNDFTNLEGAIREMIQSLPSYEPLEFIRENLSLEKQALELLTIFSQLEDHLPRPAAENSYVISNNKFKTSFRTRVVYMLFVLIRKTKTFFRILNRSVRRNRRPRE